MLKLVPGIRTGPPMLPLMYNSTYHIVQTKDEVAIEVEMVHDVRHVRLNSKHAPPQIKLWMGDSIGWWEGDTLVVETTNFNPGKSLRPGIPTTFYVSEDAKVTERFTRIAQNELLYQFTVDDPVHYTKPWSGEYSFKPAKGQIYEYACHEGNYAMEGILRGARMDEAGAKGGN